MDAAPTRRHGSSRGTRAVELRPASGGQVGVFPEHAQLWPWIRQAVERVAAAPGGDAGGSVAPEVLSLFAYTGGATLAAAAAGARVAHVDAARPAVGVGAAERGAVRAGRGADPVARRRRPRVRPRERRRGRHYDGVVVDPPSYGHGTGAWRIDARPPRAARRPRRARSGRRPSFVLLSAHTPGFDGRAGWPRSLGRRRSGDAEAGHPLARRRRDAGSAAGRVRHR